MVRGSLDDLAAFAVVARVRSFTRGAAELGTSTSNLSHTIRRLEARLGYRLLQRNSRSVAATEAGEDLLATLGPALETIVGALDTLEQGRGGVSGTLRLTMTRQAYDAVVQPVLARFTRAHPQAIVEVLIDYAYRDIVADRFDAGIRLGEKLEQDMIALKVGPNLRMAVVAAPAYLAGSGPVGHPSDLTRHRCINYRMVSTGVLYAWELNERGRSWRYGRRDRSPSTNPNSCFKRRWTDWASATCWITRSHPTSQTGDSFSYSPTGRPLSQGSTSTIHPGARCGLCWPPSLRRCAHAVKLAISAASRPGAGHPALVRQGAPTT